MYSFVSILSTCLILAFILNSVLRKKVFHKNEIILTQKATWIIFLGILIIGITLRVYKITTVPLGLHVDEAAMAYDAYSLANYGVDRWLVHNPVYLINFGSGQSAMYAYLCSFFVKLLGNNIISIRLPAIFLGIITICYSFLIGKKFLSKEISLFISFLIAVCPYFVMQSRWGLDCNLFLGFFTVALYYYLRALEKQTNGAYVLAGFCLGLCLYTYALSYLVLPLFLLFSLTYLLIKKQITFRHIFILGIPIFLLAVPLLLFIYINNFHKSSIITPLFTIPVLFGYRGAEISLNNIAKNLNIFKMLLTHDQFPYNSYAPFHTLFLCSSPLVIHGFLLCFFNAFKKNDKKQSIYFIILCGFLACILCGLVIYEPNINKLNEIFIFLILFAGISVSYCLNYTAYKKCCLSILIVLYMINSFFFVQDYLTNFPSRFYPMPFTNDCIAELVEDLEEGIKQPVNFYLDNMDSSIYIHLLQRKKISPYEFQKSVRYNYSVTSFANYSFYFPEDLDSKGIYIITWYPEFEQKLKNAGYLRYEYRKYRIYIAPDLLEVQ